MPVQTVWIYIPAHTEAEGATVISEHLQDSMRAASHPNLDLWQMEKTNLVLDQKKVIASMTNHSIITAMRQENRLTEAPAECNFSTFTAKGKRRLCKKLCRQIRWHVQKINGTPRKSCSHRFKASPFFCKVLFAAQELRQNQKFSLNIRSPTTTHYNHVAQKIESMWRINYYRFRQSEKTGLFHSTITLLFLQVWLLWLSAQYFLKRNCSMLCSCLPQTQVSFYSSLSRPQQPISLHEFSFS